jgi:diguanylate cyclase (GGDEF)-like protein
MMAHTMPEQEPKPLDVLRDLDRVTDELGHEIEKLQERAGKDSLTGLDNRRAAEEKIRALAAQLERPADERRGHTIEKIALGLFDVDHFKNVNDTYGHAGGDAVLRQVAEALRTRYSRDVDIVGRWGGEEFVVAFEDADPDTLLDRRFGRDREREKGGAIEVPVTLTDGATLTVTFSGGITEYRSGEDLDDVLARADRGLYFAKETGRNRIVIPEKDVPADWQPPGKH